MTTTLELPQPLPGRTCQRCVHWHHEEGQRTLRQHAAFFAASQHISPNQMATTAVDADGQPNEGRKRLPLLEDKWAYMGACIHTNELRHRTDRCSAFADRGPLGVFTRALHRTYKRITRQEHEQA